jgi:hypothetical protein
LAWLRRYCTSALIDCFETCSSLMYYVYLAHASGPHLYYLGSTPFYLSSFCAQKFRFFPRKYYAGQLFSFIVSLNFNI